MEKSLFTRIIQGEIPSYRIYEDDRTYAFLDIHPIAPGHTLIVPKNQVEFVWDLSAEDYASLMATAAKLARHLRTVLGVAYVGAQIIGVDVPHAHVHLIPFNHVAEYHNRPSTDEEPDHEALKSMAYRLKLN